MTKDIVDSVTNVWHERGNRDVAESTKDKGTVAGEIVATDLIVRADAHFVGAEPRNVLGTSQRELRASQNNE